MASGASFSSAMPSHLSSIRVLAAGTAWRLFGSRRAAEILFVAMSADDEQTRTLAGMSLVKAGRRSFDFIEGKIAAGEASASMLRLLPDIEGERARPILERVACGDDGDLKKAAKECVDLLDRIDSRP